MLIPAAQTPFSQDRVFGYQNSHLHAWILEKFGGAINPENIKSISIQDLRLLSDNELILKINNLKEAVVCVVNAANMYDLKKFCLAVLQAEIDPVFRTAASFVAAIACQPQRAYLKAGEIVNPAGKGGLVMVGSYVPKTTRQLEFLLANNDCRSFEIDIGKIIHSEVAPDLVSQVDAFLKNDETVVIYTGRKLISAGSDERDLAIGRKVSDYMSALVAGVSSCPRYLLTKGGITSSDITTQGLQAKRALILGQIMAGVPVWKMERRSRFPALCQIVFPGNVGDEKALSDLVKKMNFSIR